MGAEVERVGAPLERSQWLSVLVVREIPYEVVPVQRGNDNRWFANQTGKARPCKKEHGFDVITSSTGALLGGKSPMSKAAIAFADAIVGTPLGSAAPLASGISVGLGNLTLKMFKTRRAFRDDSDSHEMACLFDLR
jgi:hypothetical protein